MGLFGSKKTYVASTIYNMAGDIEDRPDFLKTLMASQAIVGQAESYTVAIKDAYLNGPGVRLKNFGAWAARPGNYDSVGVVKAEYRGRSQVEPGLIENIIPKDPGQTVNLQRTSVESADYSYWSEQWMLENHPDLFNTAWSSDYNEQSNTITVSFADPGGGAPPDETFSPVGLDSNGTYLYVLYNLVSGAETGPTVEGDLVTGAFPSHEAVDGWVTVQDDTTPTNVPLVETTVTTISYSDGRPDEVTTEYVNSSDDYDHYRGIFTQEIYNGDSGSSPEDDITSTETTLKLFRDGYVDETVDESSSSEEIDDGSGGTVTKITTVEVTTESLRVEETYRYDETEKVLWVFHPAEMLIYRIGSGTYPVIDDKLDTSEGTGFFLPFIPVRLDNEMVDETFTGGMPAGEAYDQARRAYWKMTGSRKYGKELLDPIGDHEDVDDMDFVYTMLGTSLNTKENASRRYIFEFFDRIREAQSVGITEYNDWTNNQNQFSTGNAAWIEWRLAQSDSGNPLYGLAMPSTGQNYSPPSNEVRIRGTGSLDTNMDIRIKWSSITKQIGNGLVKPGATIGDCYIDFVGQDESFSIGYNLGQAITIDPMKMDRVLISLQTSASTWAILSVVGLSHKNFIYNGKSVEISAQEALEDTEESGFLVPIHFDVFKDLPMIVKTQMSTACVYVVINTYVVKKSGFFGSIFFKILLFVAIVALTVATGGAGAGSIGLLGANGAIGAVLGLSGFIGTLVGALANALAAVVVVKIINAGATAIFGDKIGEIIGTIVSIAAITVSSGLMGGQSLSGIMGQMGSASSIIGMTSSVGGGIAGFLQSQAQDKIEQTRELEEQFREKSAEISRLYEENFGLYKALLDPMLIVNREELAYEEAISAESLDAFLQRTLMTGSDIAELTNTLLSDFADITLSTVSEM